MSSLSCSMSSWASAMRPSSMSSWMRSMRASISLCVTSWVSPWAEEGSSVVLSDGSMLSASICM